MKRVFVFQDFKSQKFWSIDVVGTDVTVNYGKLGTEIGRASCRERV